MLRLVSWAALRLGLLSVLALPGSVLGHDGSGRLDVTPAAVPAGLPVTVRGIGVGEAEPIRLVLVGTDGRTFELGVIRSDDEGGFEILVTVPGDVATGTYGLRAVLTDGDHVDAGLVIGTALPDVGELPGADEPLLRPMPTPSAGARGAPVSSAPAAPEDVRSGVSPDPSGVGTSAAAVAIVVGLVIIGAILAVGVIRARRRRAAG